MKYLILGYKYTCRFIYTNYNKSLFGRAEADIFSPWNVYIPRAQNPVNLCKPDWWDEFFNENHH